MCFSLIPSWYDFMILPLKTLKVSILHTVADINLSQMSEDVKPKARFYRIRTPMPAIQAMIWSLCLPQDHL